MEYQRLFKKWNEKFRDINIFWIISFGNERPRELTKNKFLNYAFFLKMLLIFVSSFSFPVYMHVYTYVYLCLGVHVCVCLCDFITTGRTVCIIYYHSVVPCFLCSVLVSRVCACVCICVLLCFCFCLSDFAFIICLFFIFLLFSGFFWFCFFKSILLPWYMACEVLVPWRGDGSEPLGWKHRVQGTSLWQNPWPKGVLISKYTHEGLDLNPRPGTT